MALHLEKISNCHVCNSFYSRKQLPTEMSVIVFSINFDTIVIYKKGLVTPYNKIAADTITFLDIFCVKLSKFSSRMSDFIPLPYTQSFCRLTRTSRVKSFSSRQTAFFFFYHTDVTFKSFSKGARAGISSVSSLFTHLRCFQVFELLKVTFFTIIYIDHRLISVC